MRGAKFLLGWQVPHDRRRDPVLARSADAARAPAAFVLVTEVGEADIDMLGHASNIAYLRWVQDVAVAHSAAVGLDMEGYSQLGAVFVVRRHEIDYLRPVVRGDHSSCVRGSTALLPPSASEPPRSCASGRRSSSLPGR